MKIYCRLLKRDIDKDSCQPDKMCKKARCEHYPTEKPTNRKKSTTKNSELYTRSFAGFSDGFYPLFKYRRGVKELMRLVGRTIVRDPANLNRFTTAARNYLRRKAEQENAIAFKSVKDEITQLNSLFNKLCRCLDKYNRYSQLADYIAEELSIHAQAHDSYDHLNWLIKKRHRIEKLQSATQSTLAACHDLSSRQKPRDQYAVKLFVRDLAPLYRDVTGDEPRGSDFEKVAMACLTAVDPQKAKETTTDVLHDLLKNLNK